jgi:bifunctional ADP-heptose synthase (sugar kinase/adenylyltransferase)
VLVIEPAATDAGSAAVLAALRPVDWVVQADPIGCATLLLQLRPDALGCDAATAASLPAGLKSALLPGEGAR